ncbi:MAG: MBL fold metallo-hydrolase [Desulfurococcaceae archaeon]
MKVTVISDDKVLSQNLIAKHSYSILLEVGFNKYLFGAAADHSTLEHNAKELDIDLATIDYLIVSHEHTPHYGGYRFVAQEAPFVDALIPYGSSESLGLMFRQHALKPMEVTTWTRLSEGVYVSAPFYGPPYEHFLVLNHSKGLVVISGCMHSGVRVLEDIARFFNRRIYALIGGFHLYDAPLDIVDRAVAFVAYTVKPDLVIPLHCSGNAFIHKLKDRGLNVVEAGAGFSIKI